MSTADFLIELGTEELPPTALKKLANAFLNGIIDQLNTVGLSYTEAKYFATPRRLAVLINSLEISQADKHEEKLGPNVKAAFDDEGKPTGAALGFAKKCGVDVSGFSRKETDKGERLCFIEKVVGKNTSELLPEFISDSLNKLPIPKRMRWGSSRVEFVRPVHWLVVLQDSEVIPCEVLGLSSGNKTLGHRFHAPDEIEISSANNYEKLLEEKGSVIPDLEKRQALIQSQLQACGKELKGEVFIDEDLLEEVTALVEYPVALTGKFEEEFLQVPAEALMSSMMEHQKYFPVFSSDNKLLPYFITVSNIKSKDEAQVIDGNERVIRPRLADAKFFFETDKKVNLESRLEKLSSVVFQKDLGTVLEKAQRVSKLAAIIAGLLNADTDKASRAGLLAKADLVSDMVLEFDKMQGIAGAYYALNDGEDKLVANAIEQHYLPKFSGDKLPESDISCAVALADRLDTLTGIFGINQPPTGSKDPFALRRQSLAIIRIIQEKQFHQLNLFALVSEAVALHGANLKNNNTQHDVESFILDRYKALYQEQATATEIIVAVQNTRTSNPYDFDLRLKAVESFSKLDEAESLAAANKRVGNILKKVDAYPEYVDGALLQEAAEKDLAEQISQLEQEVTSLVASAKYSDALKLLASLKSPVDTFFDSVMVMADDEAIRNNRLALLGKLHSLFAGIADISQLNTK